MAADTPPSWKTIECKRVFSSRIFDLDVEQRVEDGTARRGEFYTLKTSDWINVIAITKDNMLVLVEQFRHGSGEVELEIVGGLVDPGESPRDTALRELREESGYVPTDSSLIECIGTVLPNPAFLNNRCYTYLVTNVERSGEQAFDEFENIVVRLAPINSIHELTSSGKITHSLVIGAFYWYDRWLARK